MIQRAKGLKQPNTMVWRPPREGGIKFEYQDNPPGQRWFYEPHRRWYYFVRPTIDDSNDFLVYEPPETMTKLPQQLFETLTGWEPVQEVFSFKKSMMDRINVMLFVVLIGVVGFLCYLFYSEQQSPTAQHIEEDGVYELCQCLEEISYNTEI